MESLVVATGAESSGKSHLVRHLAAELQCRYLPEYARQYLEAKGAEYNLADFDHMWREQQARQQKALHHSAKSWIFDTDMLNFLVWAEWVFPERVAILEKQWSAAPPALYLLCAPDLPWESDPLRQNPQERQAIFDRHRYWLERCGCSYYIINGVGALRTERALRYLQS